MTHSRRIYFILTAFFILVCLVHLQGQVRGLARISGKVLDDSDNPIPNASVTVTAVEVAGKKTETFERTEQTDDKGMWKMAGLSSGFFKVEVSAPGYIPMSKNIEVSQININPQVILRLKRAEELINQDEESAGLFEEGNLLFEQGQYDEAISNYKSFLEKNPQAYQIRFNIGNCYREKNDHDLAQQEFEAVLEKASTEEGPEALKIQAKALAAIGEIYVLKNDIVQARDYFKQSLERNSQDEILAYNVGVILFSNQKLDEALEYFDMATKIKPNWADAYLKLGYVYLNKTQYDEAKTNFNKFLELAPDHPQAQSVKGILEYLEKM